MAEGLAIAASVIAIIQVSEKVIKLCKNYSDAVKDAPSDLQVILGEVSTLKLVLQSPTLIEESTGEGSSTISALSGKDGPIEACKRSISKLEELLEPSNSAQTTAPNGTKKRKIKAMQTSLAWPLKANKAKKLLDEIMRHRSAIALTLATDSHCNIKDIKTKTTKIHNMLTEDQRHNVLKWLEHTDPSPLHRRNHALYEPETGKWMLCSSEWANWLGGNQKYLWIHGIPGAGKTILMSHLIQQVEQHCDQLAGKVRASAYYYCYFGHSQDETVPMLRSVISQLCRQSDCVPNSVHHIYKRGGEPSLVELLNALEDASKWFEITYILIDALDETTNRSNLVSLLNQIATDPRFRRLRVLASSREYAEIEEVMKQISAPISMDNPSVRKDISVLVRSLLANADFKRFSTDLRKDIHEAIAGGARGMFRWAVCQVDVVRRLKSDRIIVQKALQTLPKTLYDTYDRIMLDISAEERVFVFHVLQWIEHHNELWYNGNGIPCAVLLQAVESSTTTLNANFRDRHYDEKILREVCGCLINVAPGFPGIGRSDESEHLIVSYAHYTVREYFDSNNFTKLCLSDPPDRSQNLRKTLIEILLTEAHNAKPNQPLEQSVAPVRGVEDSNESGSVHDHFNSYAVVSAVVALKRWVDDFSNESHLFDLAMHLLNPAKTHYKNFLDKIRRVFETTHGFVDVYDINGLKFWDLTWDVIPLETDAALFMNLCNMAKDVGMLPLLQKFFQSKPQRDMEQILKTRLNFSRYCINLFDGDTRVYHFDGFAIEVIAQHESYNESSFDLLLDIGAGLYDPSKILSLYIAGSHRLTCEFDPCEEIGCPLLRLLELKADSNAKEFRLSPLQVAVTTCDVRGVTTLLEAGADPDYIGNKIGTTWKKGTRMSDLNDVPNHSPLRLLREYYINLRGGKGEEVEDILLQYGATEI